MTGPDWTCTAHRPLAHGPTGLTGRTKVSLTVRPTWVTQVVPTTLGTKDPDPSSTRGRHGDLVGHRLTGLLYGLLRDRDGSPCEGGSGAGMSVGRGSYPSGGFWVDVSLLELRCKVRVKSEDMRAQSDRRLDVNTLVPFFTDVDPYRGTRHYTRTGRDVCPRAPRPRRRVVGPGAARTSHRRGPVRTQ